MNIKPLSGLKRHEQKTAEGPCYEGVAVAVESRGVQFIIVADSEFALRRVILNAGWKIPSDPPTKVLVHGNK